MNEFKGLTDNTFEEPISNLRELLHFLEKKVSKIEYINNKWNTTTNEFIENGGLCFQFSIFLSNVLNKNPEFSARRVRGIMYNREINNNKPFPIIPKDEPIIHCWTEFRFENEYYFCDPTLWSVQLYNPLLEKAEYYTRLFWLRHNGILVKSSTPNDLYQETTYSKV